MKITAKKLKIKITNLIFVLFIINPLSSIQIYPSQVPSSQTAYIAYPNSNYGNGVGNTFNGYGNIFNGNQNSINGNINNLNGNNNQVNGNANQISGSDNIVSGSGNIVLSGTTGTLGFNDFSDKSIATNFPGLSNPPTIKVPSSISINVPNINTLSNNISNTGNNLLNSMQNNTQSISLSNPPNIGANVMSNQQYSQPYNIQSSFSSFSNQQTPSFSFTQPQIQIPSFSFPMTNQGYQIISSQSSPSSFYTIPSSYSYPMMGTGSNFGNPTQLNPYVSYNSFSSQYNNPFTGSYSPYNYYQAAMNNPYVSNNPTLSNIFQQFPSYQQSSSLYSPNNYQNYQSNLNPGNIQYSSNNNFQNSSPIVNGQSAYYNNQFSQAKNLANNNQNNISGLQVLQNFMQKLNSNGIQINQ